MSISVEAARKAMSSLALSTRRRKVTIATVPRFSGENMSRKLSSSKSVPEPCSPSPPTSATPGTEYSRPRSRCFVHMQSSLQFSGADHIEDVALDGHDVLNAVYERL